MSSGKKMKTIDIALLTEKKPAKDPFFVLIEEAAAYFKHKFEERKLPMRASFLQRSLIDPFLKTRLGSELEKYPVQNWKKSELGLKGCSLVVICERCGVFDVTKDGYLFLKKKEEPKEDVVVVAKKTEEKKEEKDEPFVPAPFDLKKVEAEKRLKEQQDNLRILRERRSLSSAKRKVSLVAQETPQEKKRPLDEDVEKEIDELCCLLKRRMSIRPVVDEKKEEEDRKKVQKFVKERDLEIKELIGALKRVSISQPKNSAVKDALVPSSAINPFSSAKQQQKQREEYVKKNPAVSPTKAKPPARNLVRMYDPFSATTNMVYKEPPKVVHKEKAPPTPTPAPAQPEEDQSLKKFDKTKPTIVVLDTNCFMHALPDVQCMRTMPSVFVRVPLVVMRELDGLKTNPDVGTAARDASRVLDECVFKQKTNFAIQKTYETIHPTGEASPQNADDRVIMAGAYYTNSYKAANVYILTNDRNMRLKATAFDVQSAEIRAFVRMYQAQAPNIFAARLEDLSRPPNFSRNRPNKWQKNPADRPRRRSIDKRRQQHRPAQSALPPVPQTPSVPKPTSTTTQPAVNTGEAWHGLPKRK